MADFWNELVPPPDAPTAHLSDSELFDIRHVPGASKHLADCAWCSARRANVTEGSQRAELEGLLADLAASSVPSPTAEAASMWAIPEGLATWLDAGPEEVPNVAPGQLWRLSWRGQQTLAVVIDRKQWWTRMAPLTTDVDLADEYSLVTGSDSCSLGLPSAVFLRAAATVPLFVLSHFLGEVTVEGMSSGSVLRDLDRACMTSAEPPATIRTGARLAVDDWDRQEALDALRETMLWFEAAVAEVVDEGARAEEGSVDVVELLSNVNDFMELSGESGVAPGRLLDMLNGRAQPTAEERAALAEVSGRSVKDSLPEEAHIALIELVSDPTCRDMRRAFNARNSPGTDLDSVVPLVNRVLESRPAARSLAGTVPDRDLRDIEAWRARWRDVLAHVLANQT